MALIAITASAQGRASMKYTQNLEFLRIAGVPKVRRRLHEKLI